MSFSSPTDSADAALLRCTALGPFAAAPNRCSSLYAAHTHASLYTAALPQSARSFAASLRPSPAVASFPPRNVSSHAQITRSLARRRLWCAARSQRRATGALGRTCMGGRNGARPDGGGTALEGRRSGRVERASTCARSGSEGGNGDTAMVHGATGRAPAAGGNRARKPEQQAATATP